MSNNNNDDSSVYLMAFAFISATCLLLFVFLFVVMAFIALVFTVLALLAWNKPYEIGILRVEPVEARTFVGLGVCGAITVPVCAELVSVLADYQVNWDYLHLMLIGGYSLGSVGIFALMGDDADVPVNESTRYVQIDPPSASLQKPTSAPAPPPPFTFASWDDEEPRT